MSVFVQSLKRLYIADRVTKEQIAERVASGKITTEDYEHITGEPYAG
jgi:uncharacterized membrane protein